MSKGALVVIDQQSGATLPPAVEPVPQPGPLVQLVAPQAPIAQGPIGPEGPQGPIGPEGPPGPAGRNGTDGRNGIDGQNGTNGKDGTDGIDGAVGPQGPAGPEGPQGPMGPVGVTPGGVADQVLTKVSGTDGDVEWRTPSRTADSAAIADEAVKLSTARNISVGAASESFDGTQSISFDLPAVIGQTPADADVLTWDAATSNWIPKPATGASVSSVNGKAGVVVLIPRDLSALVVITATTTLAEGKLYGLDTTAGAFAVVLPASPVAGVRVSLADVSGSWTENNPTVEGNGEPIMGILEDITLDVANASLDFVYVNATRGWVIA